MPKRTTTPTTLPMFATTPATKGPAMNAPTSASSSSSKPTRSTVATVAAALAASSTDPSKLLVDPATPGLAGVLVLFRAPTERPTPAALRATFAAALGRAMPSDPALHAAHVKGSDLYLASNPAEITSVAALGIAVRPARTATSEWVHNGQKDGHSRWTYCDSHVHKEGGARILGDADQCAEVAPDGTLTIDPGVPADIADTLRTAYETARGVVEPSRVKSLVAAHLAKSGGRAITDDTYLLPETTTVNVGVIAGLIDLGGWGTTIAVADPARIAHLSTPITKSIEEQIADVIADAQAFVARATAVAEPTSEDMMRDSVGETVAEKIEAARNAAALWGKRLKLASLDVEATFAGLDDKVKAARDAAKAAVEARRKAREEERKAAKGKAPTMAETLAALDEEQAAEERRAAAVAKVTRA